jgi:non-heme chloroperoxidase
MRRNALLLLLAFATTAVAASNEKSATFTTGDGVHIHYIDAGPSQARAIVFEPGWTMTADIFQPQIDALSTKYRVISVDPRSQGDSDKPAEGNYPGRRARDLKELIDSLKLEKPVLVGWSMGVPELFSYVDQFGADNLGGVVLVDGFVKIDVQMAGAFPQFALKYQVDRKQATAAFVKSMYAKPQTDAYLAKVTEQSLKTPTNSAMALMFGSLGRLDWTDVLPKMANIPVRYEHEPQLQSQADAVKAKLPSAKTDVYQAGHALFVDNADQFNQMLEEVMKESGK